MKFNLDIKDESMEIVDDSPVDKIIHWLLLIYNAINGIQFYVSDDHGV